MAKIIDLKEELVYIGMDDGSITEVRRSDLNFDPYIGDTVELFRSEIKTIVTRKDNAQQYGQNAGININVSAGNNQQQQPTYVTSRMKAVNKVTYCLLAFFLGWIGVHKFYSGRPGMGILYILFCWSWIPCVASIIECIIALCKKADEYGNILV